MSKFKIIKPTDFKKPRRWVKKVFIHCTAVDTKVPRKSLKLVESTWDFHVNTRGWSDVGYNYMIDKYGTLMTARDVEKVPAAQRGFNRGSIAICLDGLDEALFTSEQERTLAEFCKAIEKEYKGNITFHGHTEVSPKSCPVIDYKRILKLDKEGNLGI